MLKILQRLYPIILKAHKTKKIFFICLWIISIHAGLFYMSYYPKPRILMGDEMTHLRDAHRSIAKVIWHEFHLTSPFYTKFLSLILLLSPNTLVIIQIIQTLILFCVAFLVYHLGYLIFKKKEVGLMAAVLLISYPPIIAFAHFFWSDILHLFFFLQL